MEDLRDEREQVVPCSAQFGHGYFDKDIKNLHMSKKVVPLHVICVRSKNTQQQTTMNNENQNIVYKRIWQDDNATTLHPYHLTSSDYNSLKNNRNNLTTLQALMVQVVQAVQPMTP